MFWLDQDPFARSARYSQPHMHQQQPRHHQGFDFGNPYARSMYDEEYLQQKQERQRMMERQRKERELKQRKKRQQDIRNRKLYLIRAQMAARCIQRFWRAYRERKQAELAKVQHAAALVITRAMRSFGPILQAKKIVASLRALRDIRRQVDAVDPATAIRSATRGISPFEDALEKLILKVDLVDSFGNATVRAARKAVVLHANERLKSVKPKVSSPKPNSEQKQQNEEIDMETDEDPNTDEQQKQQDSPSEDTDSDSEESEDEDEEMTSSSDEDIAEDFFDAEQMDDDSNQIEQKEKLLGKIQLACDRLETQSQMLKKQIATVNNSYDISSLNSKLTSIEAAICALNG
jgi:hypothetical protein